MDTKLKMTTKEIKENFGFYFVSFSSVSVVPKQQ